MRLRVTLFLLLAIVVVSTVQAGCIKCDQTTGWICYMRTDGTKSGCDNPSNAGCATWGTCTRSGGGDDCGDDCVFSLGQAEPMNNSLEVASVTITAPAAQSKPLSPATKATGRAVI